VQKLLETRRGPRLKWKRVPLDMSAKDVFDLVLGAIEIIKISNEIYKAVQDKSGIPEKLRKVSEKLPSLLEILRSAEAQYKAGQPDDQAWITARSDVKHCEEACKDLQSLLKSAYPKDDANKVDRFFKGAETVLSGKGKTAEQLLADIYGHLKLLMDRRILTNTTLLQEIKKTVDEIFPKSGITQNNTHGTTVAGDQNFNNTGSGHQINGQGSTVNFNKST
jgi:hypothetical protein